MIKLTPFTIAEHPGDRYPDLGVVQRATLAPLATDLAATLRRLLTAGALAVEGGRVIAKANGEEKPTQ
jgi:hypothetical protein